MAKGSQFERDICRQLSRWWTNGKQDDVFWRTSQSGGRATQRAKKGLKTFGHCGDISAVNPIGQPLVQLFTIELKRGRTHGCPNDLFDCRPSNKPKPFAQALQQAVSAAERAGTPHWMLISRRDGRCSMLYVDTGVRKWMPEILNVREPFIRFELPWGKKTLRFYGMRLDAFLERIKPAWVRG